MSTLLDRDPGFKPRIRLTPHISANFFENIFQGSVPELSRRTGLPYPLIYNLVHGRIKSLSFNHYRRIFGEDPPSRESGRVDGKFFRDMVDLWVFLNESVTKAEIYHEFYGSGKSKKTDYRLFGSRINTVEARLEQWMKQKFLESGLDSATLGKWIREFRAIGTEERIPYQMIRPTLLFLKYTLGVNPSLILNQWFERYESGELKRVPIRIYDNATALRKRAVTAIKSRRRSEIEKLKEQVYGEKENYTLYSEVEEALKLLKKFAGKSMRHYLGRSTSAYGKKKLIHIASWRARRIRDDCDAYIRQHPDLSIHSLPISYRNSSMSRFLTAIKAVLLSKLLQQEGKVFEKTVLSPLHNKTDYKNGLVRFDFAAGSLGMDGRAFDLMVAIHCDIFRDIATYRDRWYLPIRYLEELRGKDYFNLVAAKYEFMATHKMPPEPAGVCLN